MAEKFNKRIQSANPMHMVLLADNSGSLRGAPAASVTQAIRSWILKLQMVSFGKKPFFKFSFVMFGSSSEVVVEAVDVNDIDADKIMIDGEGGATNLTAALTDALQLVEKHARPNHCPPFVFVFTDGFPSLDGNTSDEANALERACALKSLVLECGTPRVITLGFGSINDTFMSNLASRPSFFKKVSNPNDLIQLLPSIGTPTQVDGRPATVEGMERTIEQSI